MLETVPVVSIRPFMSPHEHSDSDRAASAAMWDRAMSEVGFAFITGHGVEGETVRKLRDGFAAFFRREAAHKESYRHGPYGSPLGGFEGLGEQAVALSTDGHGVLNGDDGSQTRAADPVESYVCSRGDPAEWGRSLPAQPNEFQAMAASYHRQMRRVLDGLNQISAAALGLSCTYFDPLFSPSPTCFVVAKHYPPQRQPHGGLRYGAHTDYGGFTVLKPDDSDGSLPGSGGLEVLLKDGATWAPVVLPQEDAFVVNIGDLYEDMTNGRWMSTVHRVRAPEPGTEAASQGRLSIAFFSGPHDDAVVETIPSCVDCAAGGGGVRLRQPITAGEHLQRKILATRVGATVGA